MKIKPSFFKPLLISILIELFINLLLLLWIEDIISIVFLGNVQLFIILDVLLFLLILFIIKFFLFRIEYTFKENKVIIEKKHPFSSTSRTILINSSDLIIDEHFNLLFNIFQLERLKIYNTRLKKIVSIIVKKYDASEVINLVKRRNIDKQPYSLGKDFYYDNRNIFTIIVNTLLLFILIYLLGLLMIYGFNISSIGSYNITIYFSVGLIVIFLFTTFVDIAHQINTQVRISDYNLSLERGYIFKRRIDMPLKKIDAISVKSNISSRIFNSYILKLPLTKRTNLSVPIKQEFLDTMFIFKKGEYESKGSKINIFSLILIIVLIVFSFVLFMFIKPLLGIIISLLLLLFYLECMTSRASKIGKNSITFKNGIIFQRTKILSIQIIQKIKIRKFLFKQNILTFKTYKKSYIFIIDREKCEEIKEKLK